MESLAVWVRKAKPEDFIITGQKIKIRECLGLFQL